MTKRLKLFSLSCASSLLFLGLAPQAHASIDLTLINGSSTVTITDTTPGVSCGVGCISYNGIVGKYSINISSVTTDPSTPPIIDLSSVNKTTTNNAGALTIIASANGYTIPAGGFTMGIGGTVGAGGTLTAALYGGRNNNIYTSVPPAASQLGSTLSFGAGAFSGTTTGLILPSPPGASNPFGLTVVTTLNFGAGKGQASYDAQVDPLPVPEPAVVTMLGSMLLLTVGAIRRKTRRS